MAKQKKEFVDALYLGQIFHVSERVVQRYAIFEGMPRTSRGKYPYLECLSWFVRRLQTKVCKNCDELIHAGPCRGLESAARADRHRALEKIAGLAPRLVGLDAESIRQNLTEAIDEVCSAVD